MQEIDIQAIAKELMKAQDDNTQLAPVTSRFPNFTIDAAYKTANLIHEQRLDEGLVPVGRKIGFTNSNMWARYGVKEPVWSYIYDQTITQLSEVRAECLIGEFSEPKIEPEIVLHFSASPPTSSTPSELLEYIDWIALGFEIVQSHFPDWKFQAADTITDRGLHAALFIGEQQAVNQLGPSIIEDLEKFEIALSCNGDLCEVGRGSNVLGSPLQAALHLMTALANQSHAEPIQAGEIITTGTLTSAFTIEAGQAWNATVTGIALPDLSIRIEK